MSKQDIKDIDRIVKEEGLSPGQRRLLHEEITGRITRSKRFANSRVRSRHCTRTSEFSMDNNGRRDPTAMAASIQGLPCWYVSCGGCTLPSFELALGKKLPRARPLKNLAQAEEFRHSTGEACLFVWCSWRLDAPDAPLTSSDDQAESIVQQLNQLVGASVESASIGLPAWDLTIQFSNGLVLRVFCDHVPGAPSFEGNWDLVRADGALHVGPGSRWAIEQRHEIVPTEG